MFAEMFTFAIAFLKWISLISRLLDFDENNSRIRGRFAKWLCKLTYLSHEKMK